MKRKVEASKEKNEFHWNLNPPHIKIKSPGKGRHVGEGHPKHDELESSLIRGDGFIIVVQEFEVAFKC